jgi:hypothetical protein
LFSGWQGGARSVTVRVAHSGREWTTTGVVEVSGGKAELHLGPWEGLASLSEEWREGPLTITCEAQEAPAWRHVVEVPSPHFDADFLRGWVADLRHGFWACFQALYCRVGQPTHVLAWAIGSLRAYAALGPEMHRRLPQGFSRVSDGVLVDAWHNAAADWRAAHQTPLELALSDAPPQSVPRNAAAVVEAASAAVQGLDNDDRQLLREWQEAQADGARRDEDSLEHLVQAVHRLLVGFTQTGTALEWAVYLLLPVVGTPVAPGMQSRPK